MYYVDLTVRDGIHLQEAIHTAREIDQKTKFIWFNQAALDQTALQGFANAQFEVDGEEGDVIVEEFMRCSNQQQVRSETNARFYASTGCSERFAAVCQCSELRLKQCES